jgi:hypothetical protein
MIDQCNTCQKPITLWEDIALDVSTLEYHQCVARVASMRCYKCGFPIHFDNTMKSRRGRFIPLEIGSMKKHTCMWAKLGIFGR